MTAKMRRSLLLVLTLLIGCRSGAGDAPSPGPVVEPPTADRNPACGAPGGTAIPEPPPRTRQDPGTGRNIDAVGAALTAVPTVALDDLTRQPETYAGKRVRLEGLVTAMCAHRRAWFALRSPGNDQGANVRVVTAPAFLVPSGSTGRHARTEGIVELVEVSAGAARHYSRDHRLRDPTNPETAHRAVVLRASGAEFFAP